MRLARERVVEIYAWGIGVVGAVTLAVLAVASHPVVPRGARLMVATFVVATMVGEMLRIKIVLRGAEGEITLSTSFAFAMLIAFGPLPAALALASASIVADVLRRKPPVKLFFNVAQYVLSVAGSGVLLGLLSSVPHTYPQILTNGDLPAILLAGAAFFSINTVIVAAVIALVERISLWTYMTRDFVLQASSAGLLLGLSPVLALVGAHAVAALPLLLVPFVAIYRGERQALINGHQALHDALTGLPNRVHFSERVTEALEAGREGGLAVMLLDLDHFKEVNDTLGHDRGDALLCQVASRLGDSVRGVDSVARLGGDEFAVLVKDTTGEVDATAVAARILERLTDPVELDDLEIEVSASIGIAMYPEHGETLELLLRRADIAMYQAKRSQSGHRVFRFEQDRTSTERLTLVAELRKAIEGGELELHYQPKVELATGRVDSVEALVRWRHPHRGLVPPSDFIPLAERSGLITPLTTVVIDGALRQWRVWDAAGVSVPVAVNLSPRSFLDPDLAAGIAAQLRRWDAPGDALQLEITEGTLMGDPDGARAVVMNLTAQGLQLAIDDFGTGYSSLAQIKQLPVSEIKIDRSFIMDMDSSASDEAIVRSTIDLAHNLGLRVTAEGVEDESGWNLLRALRCDLAQGYLLSRPVPGDTLTPLLVRGIHPQAEARPLPRAA
jgi:diguanylate cyclase (GGDEF)-like protein